MYMEQYKRKVPAARDKEKGFVKFTSKQLSVYYWFISKCLWNSENKEDHYFIYRDEFSYAGIARDLGIGSVNTVKSAIQKLEQYNYLCVMPNMICIPHKEYYTYLGIDLIRFLLAWSSELGAEILMFYSILKRFYELNKKNNTKTFFNTKLMLKLLGHSDSDTLCYKKFRLYIAFLQSFDLINCEISIKRKKGGEYTQYYLRDISTHVTPSCEYKDDEDIDIDKEKIELLQSSIDFTIIED